MKVKNLAIGLRVQVKSKNHTGFFEDSAGKFGTIVYTDEVSHLDVKIKYDCGGIEWGNHKGIKRAPVEFVEHEVQEPNTPASVEVGDRVRLVDAAVLGFLAGDVGTVKHVDSSVTALIHFDEPRNGFKSQEYGIPNLQGLYVNPELLEVIAD